MEVACQAEVYYYTPYLLDTKCVELSCTEYETLMPVEQKNIKDVNGKEFLVYLFINNRNQKLHSQLKKDLANNCLKGNMEAYLSDIPKALTLMNEYKPLKLDVALVPAQGMAFATTNCRGKGKKASGGTNKYISNSDWKAISPEAQTKVINACKKAAENDANEKSSASVKSAKIMKSISKTMKSLKKDNCRLKKSVSALQKCKEDDNDDLSISSAEGLSHFQKAIKFLKESYPKIALAVKSSK